MYKSYEKDVLAIEEIYDLAITSKHLKKKTFVKMLILN